MNRRAGYTVIELLVVVAMLTLLISILVPSIARVREAVRQASCRTQLHGLATALHSYAAWAEGKWPNAGKKTIGGTAKIDTMHSMWLLVRFGYAQPDNFVCPTEEADRRAARHVGAVEADKPFPVRTDGKLTNSYSYQVPNSVKGSPGYEHPESTRFAVMADRSPWDPRPTPPAPGGKLLSSLPGWANPASGDQANTFISRLSDQDRLSVNSINHRGEGQNVLFRDSHVEWYTTPLAGLNFDNIYTRSTATSLTGRAVGGALDDTNTPYDNDDSYLRTYMPQ